MNQNLDEMTNGELKAYIRENRHDEEVCREALKQLIKRKNPNSPQYSYDLPTEEMEAVFKAKLESS